MNALIAVTALAGGAVAVVAVSYAAAWATNRALCWLDRLRDAARDETSTNLERDEA